MRTSIESVFVRVYSAVVDKLAVLEGLTRPPRRGHDMDAVDGAEQLAELEESQEIWEPQPPLADWELELLHTPRPPAELYEDDDTEADNGGFECIACGALYNKSGDHDCAFADWEYTPNPTEPGLNDPSTDTSVCDCGHQVRYCECPINEDTDRGTGCIDDGEPQQVTLNGREYERYLCGALNTPNEYEPSLTDGELVAVRRWLDLLEKGLYPDTGEVFAPREPMLRYSELWAVRRLLAERFDTKGVDRFTQAAAEAYRAMTSSADPLQASATCGDARTADDSPAPVEDIPPVTPGAGRPAWSDLAERMINHLPSAKAEDDFQPLNKNELWTAGNCVANWAASDDCADNPGYQKYLRRLATRLRDALRALRNQK